MKLSLHQILLILSSVTAFLGESIEQTAIKVAAESLAHQSYAAIPKSLDRGVTSMEVEGSSMAEAAVERTKKTYIDQLPEGTIVRPVAANHDGITQANVGSCHIFASQALMKDATGLTVSAARMFLDHLIHYGQHETVGATAKAIGTINMDHVLDTRGKPIDKFCSGPPGWEGGYIQDNLRLMQTFGGVIVPNNEDYHEVVHLMNKLARERKATITAPGPLLRSANIKLQNGGLEEIIQKALSPVDSQGRIILADRTYVAGEAAKIRVQDVTFHTAKSVTPENMKKAIQILAKKLETNAIYLAVDTDKYWPAIYEGKAVPLEGAKYSEKADHAIVLAGYETSTNSFFVMDSNNPAVIAVPATDIVLSTAYAAIFKKRL